MFRRNLPGQFKVSLDARGWLVPPCNRANHLSGTGLLSRALSGGNTDLAAYTSHEGTNGPKLVVETGP